MGAGGGRRRGLIPVLVYRSATRRASPTALANEIDALLTATAATDAGADEWAELLIACGELESAATDAVSPECDEVTPLSVALSDLTRTVARGAVAAWDRRDTADTRASAREALDEARSVLAATSLPRTLEIGVPEGFAYYGLYPETYAAAGRALLDADDACRIACIGIRSIGTTLAGVVAAVVSGAGRVVMTCTVRPRGHPFDRTLSLAPALREALAREAAADALFVVVDEGPGLSGSSFASVADALGALGVPDERIVLLPSWIPSPDALRSRRAQERWGRHRKLCVSFEQVFECSSEILAVSRVPCPDAEHVANFSAGAWRRELYEDERDWPAVQPQHERRKYLLSDRAGAPIGLLKFAGLGRHGRAAAERAHSLARAGLTPRVLGSRRGFLATEWVRGTPAHVGETDTALLAAIARHVAHLAVTTRTNERAPFDELLHIVSINTREALGDAFARQLTAALERFRLSVQSARTCAVDGRMLPHEWIRTERGWLKVDGVDHHDDHFLPGDQDPAWDVAGAMIEFLLDAAARDALVRAYVQCSGDRDIGARLPFYEIAYLATRLGYVTLGAEALGTDADGERFRALARRYTAMLRRAAVALGAGALLQLPRQWRDVRAIVFDADGTLRRTTVAGAPCPHAPHEWRLLPWVADGLLARLPWGDTLALGLASNQDHVGYGHLSDRQARELLVAMAVEATGFVPDRDSVRLCPHVLEVGCECRKPGDGMLRALLAHFDVPAAALLFVGDAPSDAEAAHRAGVRFAHVEEFALTLAPGDTRTGASSEAIVASAA